MRNVNSTHYNYYASDVLILPSVCIRYFGATLDGKSYVR
jgi:hypothetical protein